MASLTIPFVTGIDLHTSLDKISLLLNQQPQQKLSYAPWSSYPYHPEVSFAMAYGADAVLLKYQVREKHIRAVNSKLQSPVYQDSCVEFFIAFGKEAAYYNFEFNCIGANLSGYGTGRTDRTILPDSVTSQIRYSTQISNAKSESNAGGSNNANNDNLIHWQLTLAIPFTAFYHHTITSLHGQQAWANFYKCGDELPEPHFVTWSNIEGPEPNFHCREYFGEIRFEK